MMRTTSLEPKRHLCHPASFQVLGYGTLRARWNPICDGSSFSNQFQAQRCYLKPISRKAEINSWPQGKTEILSSAWLKFFFVSILLLHYQASIFLWQCFSAYFPRVPEIGQDLFRLWNKSALCSSSSALMTCLGTSTRNVKRGSRRKAVPLFPCHLHFAVGIHLDFLALDFKTSVRSCSKLMSSFNNNPNNPSSLWDRTSLGVWMHFSVRWDGILDPVIPIKLGSWTVSWP